MAGLQVLNPQVQTGTTLRWRYQGFIPNEHVLVFVPGGGGVDTYADELGDGSGDFVIGEAPGSYNLIAVGDSGLYATDPFTVVSAGVPVLTITTPSVPSGSPVYFTFSGFSSNNIVNVGIVGKGTAGFSSDLNGSGEGGLTVNETQGNYTLQATDMAGKSATAPFTITVGSNIWELISTVEATVTQGTNAGIWELISTVEATVTQGSNMGIWELISTVNFNVNKPANGESPKENMLPLVLVGAGVVGLLLANKK